MYDSYNKYKYKDVHVNWIPLSHGISAGIPREWEHKYAKMGMGRVRVTMGTGMANFSTVPYELNRYHPYSLGRYLYSPEELSELLALNDDLRINMQ